MTYTLQDDITQTLLALGVRVGDAEEQARAELILTRFADRHRMQGELTGFRAATVAGAQKVSA